MPTRRTKSRLLISALLAASSSSALAQTLFDDEMNRATFDASHNGWIVQSYAKDKGTFGIVPPSVNGTTGFAYEVTSSNTGAINMTNTITRNTYAPPTVAGQYLEFSTSVNLTSAAAAQRGLVFGISAFGTDASSNEYATNFEMLTNQINTGTHLAPNDVLSLTSFNDFGAPAGGEWSANVESGVNATAGFHTYTMRLYTNKVDYLVDNNLIAESTTDVPTGVNLGFELNAFAPDNSWPSAQGAIPNNGAWQLNADWARVTFNDLTKPTWTGFDSADPLTLKQSSNWTAGGLSSGTQATIDDTVTVPSTLYLGNASTGGIGISQTLGALLINSTKLTALKANAGTAPASPTTYSIALAGNTGNTVPLLSLGSNVTQTVDISDSTNAILNLQLGVASAGINVTNSAATLQIDSKIINSPGITTANLVKTGAGALILTNASNTYTGQLQISSGTLSIDSTGELGNTANTIELDGGALRLLPSSALTLARSVIVDANGGTITTSATTADTTTFSSPLGGSGSFTKNGAAELIFNNAAGTFDGTITVAQGNLRLINPASTAPGTTIKLTGANSTLNLRADANATYDANVEATTTTAQIFVANQSANKTNNTLAVGDVKLATTLNIGGSSGYSAQASQLNLSGNGTIATNTANLIIANGITESAGSHSLTKTGADTLTIQGTSSYTGNTTILNGTLTLAGPSAWNPALAGPGTTDIQNGTLSLNYSASSTPASLVRAAITAHQLRDSTAAANITLGYLDDTADHQLDVTPAILGDTNLDGTVDSADFASLAAHFGEFDSAVSWAAGDFNYDGTINALDFNALATNYGDSLSSSAVADSLVALVPEPSLAIIPLAFLLLPPRRRRALFPLPRTRGRGSGRGV